VARTKRKKANRAAVERAAARRDPQLERLEARLRARADFLAVVRRSIREALDDVIDGRRTRRRLYKQLSPTEKTYCGVRIESALVRNLKLPFGRKLDVSFDGIDADIKASSREGWMIGPGQRGGILLLLSFSEERRVFSAGMIRAHPEFLNPGSNRDAKLSLSAQGKQHIRWILRDEELPVSILASLTKSEYDHILEATTRAERVKRFLQHVPLYVPFPRRVIETVVGGDDPLRGTRADRRGRGRHPLGSFRVLSYQRNKAVRALGQPPLAKGEHMKVRATDV
jgi:Restriction endonuclease NaeI